jgi:hypothetical protein
MIIVRPLRFVVETELVIVMRAPSGSGVFGAGSSPTADHGGEHISRGPQVGPIDGSTAGSIAARKPTPTNTIFGSIVSDSKIRQIKANSSLRYVPFMF